VNRQLRAGHALACNGHKSDADAFDWVPQQRFYDPPPRWRAMAIRAWIGTVILRGWLVATRCSAHPQSLAAATPTDPQEQGPCRHGLAGRPEPVAPGHKTRQAARVSGDAGKIWPIKPRGARVRSPRRPPAEQGHSAGMARCQGLRIAGRAARCWPLRGALRAAYHEAEGLGPRD